MHTMEQDAAVAFRTVAPAEKTVDFFVATNGNDHWSGRLPEPDAAGMDGPFATVGRAAVAVREAKAAGGLVSPATVWIRGGRHFLQAPVVLTADDSGPVVYTAYPGESPVFDGGARVSKWDVREEGGRTVWVAAVPALLSRGAGCKQLFVNGRRRQRARLPKTGYLRIESVPDPLGADGEPIASPQRRSVVHAPGDLPASLSAEDADVVVLAAWVADRLACESYDPETRTLTLCGEGSTWLAAGAKYYVENLPEALTEPGEWYMDPASGELVYLPCPGETVADVEAFVSCIPQLLVARGEPDSNRYVEHVTFRGLRFEHACWVAGRRSGQADCQMPAVVHFEGTRNCAFEDCRVEHVGGYGIELGDGCCGNRVTRCALTDLGAGGVKLNGADAAGLRARRTGNNRVTDCEITAGGRVFHSAVGVLVMHSSGNEISHNHVHDFFYTGISCGWSWGYGDSVCRENRILKNHIHRIGQEALADLGGIYTLGIQPGTTISGNVIHDVHGDGIAWGIYLDEGSSHMVVENNVCWDISHEAFHAHYARENTVRNNVFAFSRNGLVSITRGPEHNARYQHCGPNHSCSFTLERNILIADGCPFYFKYLAPEGSLRARPFRSDMNVCWDVSGTAAIWGGQGFHVHECTFQETYDLAAWRELGYDLCSVFADPKCADLANADFALAPDSPALALGFQPIDTSDVGPRRSLEASGASPAQGV